MSAADFAAAQQAQVTAQLLDAIVEQRQRIARMTRDAGWCDGCSIYNRDWKKELSAAKKQLKAMIAKAAK